MENVLDSTQCLPVVVDTSKSRYSRLRPLPLSDVRLLDDLLEPRRRVNHETTLPSQYDLLEQTGRLDNFRRAAGKIDVPFSGVYFNDSDVYKWLEAAAWTLASDRDPELERMVNVAIGEIEDAQQPDGYLNTYFALERESERWTDITHKHELYCAGHLIQAAVAHHRATGSERLLSVARRFADHICNTFGPEEEGKRLGTDGHEEIEMALVELYRDTGDRTYLDQARFFLDVRGHGLLGGRTYHGTHGLPGGREYYQDHEPLRDMHEMVGHAVRAVYLNSGAADLYAEMGDPTLFEALERLWHNMTTRRMYVSGGIGSRYEDEAFGEDYELPNARAYAETCAAIGSVMWNWRMLAIDGDARYADLLEHTLYNAALPGLSLDGQSYFYQNPLSDSGAHRRSSWFGVACCPPNAARLLASLPGYFYGVSDDGVWVHLYAEGRAEVRLSDDRTVSLRQRTHYPWDGNVTIEVDDESDFGLMLRIPAWCEEGAEIDINGHPFDGSVLPSSYAEIRRTWRPGDRVRLALPMPVRYEESHPYVAENAGRVAIMRGPLLYCVEQVDNPGLDLRDIVLPDDASFSVQSRPDLLGGVAVLETLAEIVLPDEEWRKRLYCRVRPRADEPQDTTAKVTAIPYYAWANRDPGPMRVWLRSRLL
jgi:uncharacterized protein